LYLRFPSAAFYGAGNRIFLGCLFVVFPAKSGANPNVAKAGGLQRPGVKGEVVVTLPRSLYNAGSEVLRLSRRVNNIPKSTYLSSSLYGISRKWDITNISVIITEY
jgi:hypothetical protein